MFETIGYLIIPKPNSYLAWAFFDGLTDPRWQLLHHGRDMFDTYHASAGSCVKDCQAIGLDMAHWHLTCVTLSVLLGLRSIQQCHHLRTAVPVAGLLVEVLWSFNMFFLRSLVIYMLTSPFIPLIMDLLKPGQTTGPQLDGSLAF